MIGLPKGLSREAAYIAGVADGATWGERAAQPGTFADTSRPKSSAIEVEIVVHGANNSTKTIHPRSISGRPGHFRVWDGAILTIDLDLDVTER